MDEPSPRVTLWSVDFITVTLEELAEIKMERGSQKFNNPDNYVTGDMIGRYLKHIGEFLVALEDMDYTRMMEYIADVQNVGTLLFPKVQEDYIKQMYEETQAVGSLDTSDETARKSKQSVEERTSGPE